MTFVEEMIAWTPRSRFKPEAEEGKEKLNIREMYFASKHWRNFRKLLADTLKAFPDARDAVMAAIQKRGDLDGDDQCG